MGRRSILALLLSLSLVAVPASDARTGGGSLCDGDWCWPCFFSSTPGVIFVTPGGNGPTLASLGLEILVELYTCGGEPMVGFGAERIGIVPMAPSVRLCTPIAPDHPTDPLGTTEFTGIVAGGGSWPGGGPRDTWAVLHLDGQPTILRQDLAFVSPDLNADLRVDLADIAEFAIDFQTPEVEFRSDLTMDGIENLADIGVLAIHLGEVCP